MRVELPRRLCRPAIFLLTIALVVSARLGDKASAQEAPKARTTLVIFSDVRMKDDAWAALFEALQRGLPSAAAEEPSLRGGMNLIRGDRIAHGLQVEKPISVYLHGDCTLIPLPRTTPMGRLGWVWRVHGRIEPFIHVDCEQIVQMLGPLALGMNRNRRNTVMGEAIARVMLHEWVHIATQNPGHAARGVAKSRFGVADLLADDEEMRRDSRIAKGFWRGL